MPTYNFPLTLVGSGENVQEAWEDAVLSFSLDPGHPDNVQDEDGNPLDSDGEPLNDNA